VSRLQSLSLRWIAGCASVLGLCIVILDQGLATAILATYVDNKFRFYRREINYVEQAGKTLLRPSYGSERFSTAKMMQLGNGAIHARERI